MTKATVVLDLLETSDLFEMSNLDSEDTGIPGYIWVSTKVAKHGPRVKYYKDGPGQGSYVSISIAEEPQILDQHPKDFSITATRFKQISGFIVLNKENLLHFWNNGTTMTRKEVANLLASFKPLPRKKK